MLRVAMDTSTLVGAVLHAQSVPHRAWLYAQQSSVLIASRATFDEIGRVFRRERLIRYVHTETRDEFLALYRISVDWVDVTKEDLAAVEPSCRDPKDNIFLALAQVGGADILVSSDQGLLVLHPWRGVAILTPAQFLAQIEI